MAYPGLASNRTGVMLSSLGPINTCFLCHAQRSDWLWRFAHGLQIHNICFATRRLESPGATTKKLQGTYESSGGGTPAGDPWEYFDEAAGNRGCCCAWRSSLRTCIAYADCLARLCAPSSNGPPRPISPLIPDGLPRPGFLLDTFGFSPGTLAWVPGFPPLKRQS